MDSIKVEEEIMTNRMIKLFLIISLMCTSAYSYSATLMVHVDFKNHQHQVINAWLVDKELPTNFFIKGRNDDIKMDILDYQNNLLTSYYANNPSSIYGAYILATEEEKKQLNKLTLQNNKGSYYIRVPNYNSSMKSVQLSYLQSEHHDVKGHEQTKSNLKRVVSKPFTLQNM